MDVGCKYGYCSCYFKFQRERIYNKSEWRTRILDDPEDRDKSVLIIAVANLFWWALSGGHLLALSSYEMVIPKLSVSLSLSLSCSSSPAFYFPSLLVLTASNSSTFPSPATGHCNMVTCHGLRCSTTFPQLGGSLFGQRTTNVAVLHKKELWMEIELDAGKERKFCRLNGVHNLFFPEVVNWNWI